MFAKKWWNALRDYSRKSRRPKAAKPIKRWAYLDAELLEKRDMFSTAPWLLRTPFPSSGAGFDQDPWLAVLGPVLLPSNQVGSGLSSNSYQTTGVYIAEFTGAYTFTLHIEGSLEANGGGKFGPDMGEQWMTFDETGIVTFDYGSAGTVANGVYSGGLISGLATAVVSWHFESDITSDSGNGTYSSNSGNIDPFHWYADNWDGLLHAVSDANSLNLYGYSWDTFLLDETGAITGTLSDEGTVSATLGSSLQTLGGQFNLPPGSLPVELQTGLPNTDSSQSGTLSYQYTRLGCYTFDALGTGTFTLHDEGSKAGPTH